MTTMLKVDYRLVLEMSWTVTKQKIILLILKNPLLILPARDRQSNKVPAGTIEAQYID